MLRQIWRGAMRLVQSYGLTALKTRIADFAPKSLRPSRLSSMAATDKVVALDICYIIAVCKFMPTSWECEIAALAMIWTSSPCGVELSMPLCGQSTEIGQAVAR
jgi:hypothetical protein